VTVDSKPIFSKKDQGRFPSEKEIIDQLKAMGVKSAKS
jgi:hypothetical protein